MPAAEKRGVTDVYCCTKAEISSFIHSDIKACSHGGGGGGRGDSSRSFCKNSTKYSTFVCFPETLFYKRALLHIYLALLLCLFSPRCQTNREVSSFQLPWSPSYRRYVYCRSLQQDFQLGSRVTEMVLFCQTEIPQFLQPILLSLISQTSIHSAVQTFCYSLFPRI